ncbi:MAG TPA: SDR family NAD(P)-dependent oxidoreductase [Thermoanaerobaculia bacterium]|nr:SDR family NAD(P)-dependent oxidoreductase [Thermoanaerobaculia bacterium]
MGATKPMAGRAVLVTGATSGIGLETARQLAAIGARVILGVRDPARGAEVAAHIAREGGSAEVLPIDLASFRSVREAAARFEASHSNLEVLVNNAGTAVPRRQVTGDGHELTWQTNFLSGFLLTRLLLPVLKRGERPRIVNVSSEGHRKGRIDWGNLELERAFGGFQAYANTKLAQILFTRELARRERDLTVNALHPGAIATRIWRNAPPVLRYILMAILPSPAKGAAPVTRLASDPALDGVTGRYFKRFREAAPSTAASSDADAARLWQVAEEQIGLA